MVAPRYYEINRDPARELAPMTDDELDYMTALFGTAGWWLPADWRAGALWVLDLEVVHGDGSSCFAALALTRSETAPPDPRRVYDVLAEHLAEMLVRCHSISLIDAPRRLPQTQHVPHVADLRRARRRADPRRAR